MYILGRDAWLCISQDINGCFGAQLQGRYQGVPPDCHDRRSCCLGIDPQGRACQSERTVTQGTVDFPQGVCYQSVASRAAHAYCVPRQDGLWQNQRASRRPTSVRLVWRCTRFDRNSTLPFCYTVSDPGRIWNDRKLRVRISI